MRFATRTGRELGPIFSTYGSRFCAIWLSVYLYFYHIVTDIISYDRWKLVC